MPYSWVIPLPPWVCTARSAASQAASAAAYLAMFAASPAPRSSPASQSAAAFWVISRASSISMLRHRQRVGDGLVRADRALEHRALLGVRRRLADREPRQARGERRRHDPLGVEPGEQLHEPGVLVADEGVGRQPHVVDEHLELLLRD